MCTTPADQGIAAAKQDNTVATNRRNAAIQALAKGYADKAAEYIYEDQRFTELMHEVMTDFIDEHLDIITDDFARVELAMCLMDKLTITTFK